MGIFSPLVQTAVSPVLRSNHVLLGASFDDVLDEAKEYERSYPAVKHSKSMPHPTSCSLNREESFDLLPVASIDVTDNTKHSELSHLDIATAKEQSMPILSSSSIVHDDSAAAESSEEQSRLEVPTKFLAGLQQMLTNDICIFEQNSFLDYVSLDHMPSPGRRSRAVSDWTGLQELRAADTQASITDLLQPLPVMRSSTKHSMSNESTQSDGTESKEQWGNAECNQSTYDMQSDCKEYAEHSVDAECDQSARNMQSDFTEYAAHWGDADHDGSLFNMQSNCTEYAGQWNNAEHDQGGGMWLVPCYAPCYMVLPEPCATAGDWNSSPPEPPEGKEAYKPKWVYGSSWPFNHAPTTLRLSNLPRELTQLELLHTLDSIGFSGFYDFVFLPINLHTGRSRCHAFVNLTRHKYGLTLAAHLHNFKDWNVGNNDTGECKVEWSLPMQGLIEHVDHYRNHAAMHASVPDEMRPTIFVDGWRMPFPSPTKHIHAPQLGFLQMLA